MKKLMIISGILVGLTFCGPSKKTQELMKLSMTRFGVIQDKMPGSQNDTKDLVKLGKKLYFEVRLSINDKQSCNSCHLVNAGGAGVDNSKFSPGALGKLGGRNAPTVFNAGFHIAQFWDGRAKDLKEQAKGPILNPVEMGMPNANSVVTKIKAIAEYKNLFKLAYPTASEPITYDNLANAIAAFERTLRTYDRFDDFMKGEHKALTQAEQKGLETFMKTGCNACHNGALLGGNSYQKLGVANPYSSTSDLGRYSVTKEEKDRYVFKVPSLRNITNTAPYFHDGSIRGIAEAVEKMAWMQLGKRLEKKEIKSIVTFLKALSDKPKS